MTTREPRLKKIERLLMFQRERKPYEFTCRWCNLHEIRGEFTGQLQELEPYTALMLQSTSNASYADVEGQIEI